MVGGIRYTTIEAVERFLTCRASPKPLPNSENIDQEIDEVLRRAGV